MKKTIFLNIFDFIVMFVAGVLSRWFVCSYVHGMDILALTVLTLVYIFSLHLTHFYKVRIENSSIDLLYKTIFAFVPVTVAAIVLTGLQTGFNSDSTRTVFVFALVSYLALNGSRASYRILRESSITHADSGKPKAIVYGAGDLGSTIARQSLKGKYNYSIVGFIDDSEKLQNELVMDRPVFGKLEDLEGVLKKNSKIQTLIIAVTNISSEKVQTAVTVAKKYGLSTMIVPNLFEVRNTSDVNLRQIDYADLLGRPLITIQKQPLFEMFQNKTILVTGAGGSIGSEICTQLMEYNPNKLIVLDIDETELHDLSLRLLNYEKEWSEKVVPVVCDIKNREKIERIFDQYKPDIVFHAAAYKHVPLMELYPEEAILTNIVGSYNVFEAAKNSKVKRVVVISTDKAVNPTNIMGATKRVVEMMSATINSDCDTDFCCVRFGNVIGSRGSMLPLFLEEIKAGKPVTVTDTKIIRYFMAIPEAVSLVFRAATLAQSGEVMVLDMGEPVNIYNFATKLVDIFGDGRSYVKVVGLRPGEKLYEELLANKDNTIPTTNAKIFKAKVNGSTFTGKDLEKFVEDLKTKTPEELVEILKKTVPEYKKVQH